MAINPEKVSEGSPCERCGGTLRWKSNRQCVECNRAAARRRQADRYADPEYAEAENERCRDYYRRNWLKRRQQINAYHRNQAIEEGEDALREVGL